MPFHSPRSLGESFRRAAFAVLSLVALAVCSISTDLSELSEGRGAASGAQASGATGGGGAGGNQVVSGSVSTGASGGVVASGGAGVTAAVSSGSVGGSGGAPGGCDPTACAAACPECQICACVGEICQPTAEFHTPCGGGVGVCFLTECVECLFTADCTGKLDCPSAEPDCNMVNKKCFCP